ncbi:MAG: metal ABC transporter permease [Gammaproteobacteria bacterium]|nr:metal ABC transporter permease [Gammaproteobacteria bacterium]MDX2487459.1 metal ABC transporter permease [Gammaproteobacteria bacterium]
MTGLFSALQYDFMQNALLGSLLVAIMCAITGTFIVIKRLVFLSGGISHGAFAGLGAAYFLGINPMLGAMLFAVLSAVAITRVILRQSVPADATIGIFWATGMAAGVLFIYITPGYAPDLMPYLFGDILTISKEQLFWMTVFSLLSVLFTGLLFRQLVAVSFDEDFARLRGLPVGAIMMMLMIMNSVAIVLMIQSVGIILVMALLTIPPLVGLALAAEIRTVMLYAFLSAVVITVGGLALSFLLDLPSGPAIVLLGVVLLAVVKFSRRFSLSSNI